MRAQACARKKTELVSWLLQREADIYMYDHVDGFSALHAAAVRAPASKQHLARLAAAPPPPHAHRARRFTVV